jgi:hypothetical protein
MSHKTFKHDFEIRAGHGLRSGSKPTLGISGRLHMKKRQRFVLVSLGIIVSLLLVSCQSNELSKSNNEAGLNGSFETTESGYPVNWAFFPNPESDVVVQISVDTTKAQEGKQSLKLATSQSEKTVGFRSRRVPVQPGRTYNISFAVQNDGCILKVRRIVQDSSGTDNRRSEIIVDFSSPTSDWKTFKETLVVSDGEASVVLIFLVDGPGTLWVDGVQVEELAD